MIELPAVERMMRRNVLTLFSRNNRNDAPVTQLISVTLAALGHGGDFSVAATTEPIRYKTLAADYREQAEVCLRMAKQAVSPYDQEWLRIAAKWMRLARQAEVKAQPRGAALDVQDGGREPDPRKYDFNARNWCWRLKG